MRIREPVNGVSHLLGLVLAASGTLLLLSLARGTAQLTAFSIYGATLVLLYSASTLYHSLPLSERPLRALRTLDHIAIYFLIAGTYTPILLVLIRGPWGWSLLGVLWAMAIAGTLFKLHFTGRYDVVSTLLYIVMGWIGLVAAGPAFERIPGGALAWIFAGGIAYTAGVVFYLWDHLPFNHAVWHCFVLCGSVCHFLAVLIYVVPAR